MKKRKFLVSLICLLAMLGVSATALTSCKTGTKDPVTPEVEYWKVTIDLNDGSTPTTKDVIKGEKLTGVSTPTREGYDFAGWKVNGSTWTMDTAITGNITIVAQWTPKQVTPAKEYCTVTIDLNDGTDPTTKKVEKGGVLTGIETPIREGYEFTGWKANDTDWTMDTAITANITIVAQWKEKTVTPVKEYWIVTIDLNDGTSPKTQQVEKGQKLTDVSEPTREGYEFTGWKANDTDWTMDTAITANITIVAQWRKVSDYEIFVSKGNIIYASDFIGANDVLHSNIIGSFEQYDEAYGKWFGTVNDYDDFDELNKVFVQNGYLNVVDNSDKTTYAQLILSPVYASVVEVKAVIQTSTVAENWSIFTIMSPFSSSEYLLNLKTNAAKEICLQTRVYDETEEDYKDSILPTSGGFVFVENKDLVIEATFDLSTGEITVTLSQEGKTKTLTGTIDKEGYENQGLPLTFSGVQIVTAESESRSIKMDWLGARIVSENVEALKALALAQLEANYEDYDKSEYTQQLELLEKTYADGVAAIEACTTNAEVIEALNEIDEAFQKIKSDSQLEAEAMVEVALQELTELKEQYKNSYTITKDSEDDYHANKESFDELFLNAFRNLENPWSVEQVQNEVAYVRNTLTEENSWLQNDETLLERYRQYLVDEARNYGWENGFGESMSQVEEDIIAPLEEELAALDSKAEMKACYTEYLELFDSLETEEEVLARTKQEACTEIEECAELALEDLNAETDAELIASIGNVKDNAILSITNASTIDEVDYIKNTAMNEIEDLAGFAGWSLADIILYAKTELEDYIDQKKSNYNQDYALNALDQVWIDHEHDFDGLTTVVEVIEKLKELKAMVDAITESNITITYSYDDAVDTVTYAFGEEIDRRIRVGDADERFVWVEEDTNQEFDFSNVLPNQSYTLYGQWHDIIKKINEFHRWDYSSTIPENNDIIEYTFDGDSFMETFGIAMSGESNANRNIKITLPSKGRIVVFLDNFTNESPTAFIDTSINITNTYSSYGSITLEPASSEYVGYSWGTLTSDVLQAGTYYLNWTGELNIDYIEVFYEVEKEIEFTRFIGESYAYYRTGSYYGKLDLRYIWLETTTGELMNLNCIFFYDPEHSLEYWYYMSDIIDIEVENYEEFHEV
ncbi:MAG: InlB B-repeat-containing protein, partial [Anaeroplasmataceae bacterium]|nr:InlB B-repeat-containing protein [Anaeroplasmataceae bacterium]